MKKIKHKSDLLFAIIVVCVIVLFVFYVSHAIYGLYGDLFYGAGGLEIQNFKNYKKDFERVSAIAYDYWDEKKAEDSDLSEIHLSCTQNNLVLNLRYEDSSKNKTETVPLSEEDYSHFSQLHTAFASSGIVSTILTIHVYKSQIVYQAYPQHTVVYTRNGLSPEFMYSPDSEKEYKHTYYERMSLHLFQCVGKNE
ncbi:MAG: hypothetical protein ACI3YK_04990 [Eubacteriales bacterium]